ncbi:MAG: DUF2279 domain-containing protein [Saprospiraceae bacterium]|jgi:hypothetical protein|nr:DUF2279 domain-containing protein [Saprospiraceae bacterium]
MSKVRFFIAFLTFMNCVSIFGQNTQKLNFFQRSDTFNQKRFWSVTGFAGTVYTGTFLGLGVIWYAQYPKSSFHFFDDAGEWRDMDKYGHAVTSNATASMLFTGARWSGLSEKQALWSAVGVSYGALLTLEVLDGFSAEWGFSLSDLGMNTLGVGIFALQQVLWHEQRIVPKWSSFPKPYPNLELYSSNGLSTNLQTRAVDLFGSNYIERMIKDYNASRFWLSCNVKSFLPDSNLPKWLNVAVGFGAENMYGGFANQWNKDGEKYVLPSGLYPRYSQYYLTFDIDTSKIPTKNHFLKTVLGILNCIKVPMPGLEITSRGKFLFHPILM